MKTTSKTFYLKTMFEVSQPYKNISKIIRKVKEDWIDQKCNDLDEDMPVNNSRLAFNMLQMITGSKQSRARQIKDNDGKILSQSNKVLERLKRTY